MYMIIAYFVHMEKGWKELCFVSVPVLPTCILACGAIFFLYIILFAIPVSPCVAVGLNRKHNVLREEVL